MDARAAGDDSALCSWEETGREAAEGKGAEKDVTRGQLEAHVAATSKVNHTAGLILREGNWKMESGSILVTFLSGPFHLEYRRKEISAM